MILPMVVVALPEDYFVGERRHPFLVDARHPLVRPLLLLLKNLLGVVLLVLGVLMLVLPGQGLLTILSALVLLDFPGKFRFERWLASREHVLRAVNWLRRKRGRAPLSKPEPHG